MENYLSLSARPRLRRLFTAIQNKNMDNIRTLINQLKMNVNCRRPDADGHTPLHVVARNGNIKILKLFVGFWYVNVNVKDNHGFTALHYVVKRQKLDEAKILFDAGGDIITEDKNGKTPFHYLIEDQVDLNVIKSFMNLKNVNGKNPLFAAVNVGNIEIMNVLIDYGCDIKCVAADGSTLLHEVARSNLVDSHFEVAELLLKNGLDVNAQDKDENTALHYLEYKGSVRILCLFLNYKANINIKNNLGEIPLFKAICGGNAETVQLLLDCNSDLHIANIVGSTPLHKAARCNHGNSHSLVADILLRNGADVNAQEKDGNTPLHWLVKRGNVEIVQLCLNFKADVHVKNSEGEIPLFNALRSNVEVVKLLLNHGSDVNSFNEKGATPLHNVVHLNSNKYFFKVAEILLEKGSLVNAQDIQGNTPLHNMVNKADVKIVQLLLNFEAGVHIKNNRGEIPLFSAVKGKNVEVVQLLINHGSDVKSVNNNQLTSLHLAAKNQSDSKIIKCLLKNGADVDAINLEGQTPLLFALRELWYENFYHKTLLLLLDYSNINLIDQKGNDVFSYHRNENDWKICLKHVAKLQALDISINPSILKTISNGAEYRVYFDKCLVELTVARNTKLKNCWVSFFNLLVDNKRKLKNYAGNVGLIKEFEKSDCIKIYPIYGTSMEKNLKKGIQRRKLYDKSAGMLSNRWPIFSPTHLIIRGIFDCLDTKDLSKFSE